MNDTSTPRVLIRADASRAIGTGHVLRCLTLADALAARGARIVFACRKQDGDLLTAIRERGFEVVSLGRADLDWRDDAAQIATATANQAFDLLIVDHYDLDARWERALRGMFPCIGVIDDLANRAHDCDILIDQTYGIDEQRYRQLVPPGCRTLLGTQYALLRPQFAQVRELRRLHGDAPQPQLVHLFLGGADPRGVTLRFADLLLREFPNLSLRVAVGAQWPFTDRLEGLARAAGDRLEWNAAVTDMARHMGACGLAIGAPGMATWERACLGLPAAYVAVSSNQVPILEALARQGFCAFLGSESELSDEQFVAAVGGFLSDPSRLAEYRALGMATVDGRGTERVVDALLTRLVS